MTGTDASATSVDTRLLIGGERFDGDGERLAVENPATETKHVHIETAIAPKEWWYPYGGTGGSE